MSETRFSKASLLDNLIKEMRSLEKKQAFNPRNGWAQVKNSSIERAVDYGRYSMLQDLIEDYS